MAGHMKPIPFKKLLDEANELGIDTDGFDPSPESTDALRMIIARKTEEIATEAASKAKLEALMPDDEDEEFEGFDEAAGKTRGVLVRLVEWAEWVPIQNTDEMPGLSVANGVSGFEAGEHEKVVSIESIDTNQRKRVTVSDDKYNEYSLHVFKVVLANNVTTDLLEKMLDVQGGKQDGIRPYSKIHIPDAIQPNRAQRRSGGKRIR